MEVKNEPKYETLMVYYKEVITEVLGVDLEPVNPPLSMVLTLLEVRIKMFEKLVILGQGSEIELKNIIKKHKPN